MKRLAQRDAAWLVVVAAYLAIFGGILVYSDFLPFTFDNNESFSAYWHARNIYEYGFASSSGLADEAFSYDPAAHPYVYTHSGAGPRLFAYVLYLLGARTVELQIALTIFTVGLLGVWFAYRFLAAVSTRLYAAIACLLLMTDYILFAQWHVGIWHSWKTILLFAGLYLAHRVAHGTLARPLLTVFAFHAFLFYYETIFNVYVAACALLYLIFSTRDVRSAMKFGSAQFAGALTAAVILISQLLNQLGWEVLRTDIHYTFIGRNYATDAATFLEEARKFYADHNIVFWLNVPESSSYRNLTWALRVLFQDHAVHTPPWSLVLLAFASAELVRRLPRWRTAPAALPGAGKPATVAAMFVLGAASGALFGVLARHPELGAGLPPALPVSIIAAWPLMIGGGVLFAASAVLAPLPHRPAGAILGAAVFVMAVLAFLLVQAPLYAGGLQPVWRAALAHFAGTTTAAAFFMSVMVVLAAAHAFAPVAAAGGGRFDRLLPALAALLLAYLLVYAVFTGYIRNGYYLRYLPLTVFFNALLLALGLVAMIDCARGWYASFRHATGWRRVAGGGGATVAAFGLAAVLVYWGILQGFLFKRLPPDSLAFVPVLSKPPFRDSSFAALAYGGVVAYFTKKWAYFDTHAALGAGQVTLGPDGYQVKRDNAYVWFADRKTNAAYDKPEYYFTMAYRSLGLAFLTDARPRPRAGDLPLIRAIREGRTAYLHPVEVARDPSPADRWSVVRFDWDFPPFLRPLETGELVKLGGDATRIRVDYRYAHQEAVPEAGTRVTVFAQAHCAGPEQAWSVPVARTAAREFALPPGFSGTVRAEVQPATATKSGPVYASQPLALGAREPCPDGARN